MVRANCFAMPSDDPASSKKFEVSEVTTVSQDKSGHDSFGRRTKILAAAAVIILLIIVVVCLSIILSQDEGDEDSASTRYPVILISADGFRADYLTRGFSPNLTKFGNSGVRAKFMLSQFPTKTFPNHYTIVTGLYPETHGIVFNTFYDPVLRRLFTIRRSRWPSFWSGEPIWITANKSGLKSASFYWVGSEVVGFRSTYYRIYNQSVGFSARVKQVLKWLQLPKEQRPSVIMLYFHVPDYGGHGYGPNSDEVNKQIRLVDKTIGQLMMGLEEMKISDSVNMIFVSDHGMRAVNCNNTIFLDKYGVSPNELYITNRGPVLTFKTRKRSDREKVFNKIKCQNDSFQSFYKTELPKRMHFSNNRRIEDIIVFAEPGELVSVNSSAPTGSFCELGTHGYDNILPDMRTVFLARGPSFQKGKVVEHFSNLEIYNLLAALLKIDPAPNNGTIGSLNRLLVPSARSRVPKSEGDGTVFRTDICKFPSDKEFESRSKCCVCVSCNASEKDVGQMNKIFKITDEEARSYQEEHLPWGLPEGGVGKDACLLTQRSFIIGYNADLRIPLWTANTINGKKISRSDETEECYRSDVRLTENQSAKCTSYNGSGFDQGQFVSSRDLNFDKMDMLSASTFANVVPMYAVFRKGIWEKLESMIRDWAVKHSLIHVITGAVFDADNDGLKDGKISTNQRTHKLPENPAIPTHFYKIVASCETNSTSEFKIEKCSGSIRVISFILQHKNEHCQFHSYEKLLLQNVAPVRDIELLTGINFFPKLPRQLQVELKTFIPVQLWS